MWLILSEMQVLNTNACFSTVSTDQQVSSISCRLDLCLAGLLGPVLPLELMQKLLCGNKVAFLKPKG